MSTASSTPAPVTVEMETTPNPNSFRFAVNRVLGPSPGQDFPDAAVAERHPLAKEIFQVPGVSGVYVGPVFVTVTVGAEANWVDLKKLVTDLIKNHLEQHAGAPVPAPQGAGFEEYEPKNELEKGIANVLNAEIRPAVAMDGGDIQFMGVEQGIVKLKMRGSCHGCPSSLMTLKMGIEARLKQQFPNQIESVEAVS